MIRKFAPFFLMYRYGSRELLLNSCKRKCWSILLLSITALNLVPEPATPNFEPPVYHRSKYGNTISLHHFISTVSKILSLFFMKKIMNFGASRWRPYSSPKNFVNSLKAASKNKKMRQCCHQGRQPSRTNTKKGHKSAYLHSTRGKQIDISHNHLYLKSQRWETLKQEFKVDIKATILMERFWYYCNGRQWIGERILW